MVSGIPSSRVKNVCTGALHKLTHMPTHPLSARYLPTHHHHHTYPCLPGTTPLMTISHLLMLTKYLPSHDLIPYTHAFQVPATQHHQQTYTNPPCTCPFLITTRNAHVFQVCSLTHPFLPADTPPPSHIPMFEGNFPTHDHLPAYTCLPSNCQFMPTMIRAPAPAPRQLLIHSRQPFTCPHTSALSPCTTTMDT